MIREAQDCLEPGEPKPSVPLGEPPEAIGNTRVKSGEIVLAGYRNSNAVCVERHVHRLGILDCRREGAAPSMVGSYEVKDELRVPRLSKKTDALLKERNR